MLIESVSVFSPLFQVITLFIFFLQPHLLYGLFLTHAMTFLESLCSLPSPKSLSQFTLATFSHQLLEQLPTCVFPFSDTPSPLEAMVTFQEINSSYFSSCLCRKPIAIIMCLRFPGAFRSSLYLPFQSISQYSHPHTPHVNFLYYFLVSPNAPPWQ